MRTKITADSTCDLPQVITDKYNITIVPLYILKDGVAYKDVVEITVRDVFEYVESGAGMTHTSGVNVSDYQECFAHYLTTYDALIHVSIGGRISTCYQNALIAAEGINNVFVIDSNNLSTGSGHIVLDAAIMAMQGMPPQDIVNKLEPMIPLVESSFVIGTLKYLHKGGRCSGVAALGANLLKLNPCIEVIDGKMDVGKKYRGTFEKIILQYVDDKLKGRGDIDSKRIFVTYPPSVSDAIVGAVVERIKSIMDFDEIITCEAGCVISNHCGPVCVGILFYRKP